MKNLVFLLMFVAPMANANDLTSVQASTWETEIDNICGDTWCEGDFNWGFDEAKCDFEKGICTMDLTLMDRPYYRDDKPTALELKELEVLRAFPSISVDLDYYEEEVSTYTKTCVMKDMKSLADVLDEGETSYSEKSYDLITDCITEMEEEFYALQDKAFVLSRVNICSVAVSLTDIEVQTERGDGYGRKFYNEEVEFKNLQDYTKRTADIVRKYDVSFTRAFKDSEKDAPLCKQALREIEEDYHILAFNLSEHWKAGTTAVRLTKKRRWREVDSINFTIKR